MPDYLNGIPYATPSDYVGSWPATSAALAQWIDTNRHQVAIDDVIGLRDLIRQLGSLKNSPTDETSHAAILARLSAIEANAATLKLGSWVGLTLMNGWKPYLGGGGYYGGLRARKTTLGIQVQGMIASGPTNSTIAGLPDALQPPYAAQLVAPATGGTAICSVSAASDFGGKLAVRYNSGSDSPAYVSINATIPTT